MAFSAQQSIPHPPAAVAEALVSEDFHRSVVESFGGALVSFSVTGSPEGEMTVTTVRSAPADRLPDMARKVIGGSLQVEQVERWGAPAADGSRTGTTTITVPAAKATADGTLSLAAAGEGSQFAVDGTLVCKIPLVGSKLAAKAEPMVGKVVDRQARAITAWIERGGQPSQA
ncbi:DUF2505 domain-containing protein [Micrococcus sp. EYE_162]|uniref:DUF2505 domain-containing protein n=1 Tax=Micrococcus TaxID=1269 RepID=UPI002003603C|nr:DUF2505 domain-containing protein [Micrococcus sp. EYE_212]MCK6171841.1 DUF2505 domain-containing protein [Micrococcus sp. EYE_162]